MFSAPRTHDICLSTDSHQTVDVLADRDKNLPGHMTAFLGAWSLIFNVDTSSPLLNEHLGKLHYSSQPTMTGIGISNNGPEEISVGKLGSLFLGGAQSLFPLLTVVEQLRKPEMVDLVGDSGLLH